MFIVGTITNFIFFQSHHTGIETRAAMYASYERATFNRTILELKLVITFNVCQRNVFQSHHTGIETTLDLDLSLLQLAFNRTILELKLISKRT